MKTKKPVLNGAFKAEKTKAVEKQSAAPGKLTEPKHRLSKPSGTAIPKKQSANPATKSQPQKTEEARKSKRKKSTPKVVRHHFTMPENEYSLIAELKKKLFEAGIAVKKSDLLRAGIKELSGLSQASLSKKLSKLYLNI